MFAEGLQKLGCGHSDVTPSDDKGQGICVRCGCVVQVVYTRGFMEESFRKLV